MKATSCVSATRSSFKKLRDFGSEIIHTSPACKVNINFKNYVIEGFNSVEQVVQWS